MDSLKLSINSEKKPKYISKSLMFKVHIIFFNTRYTF